MCLWRGTIKTTTLSYEDDLMDGVIDGYFESEIFRDKPLHCVCHYDYLNENKKIFSHWHEAIEILYFKEGTTRAICNQEKLVCNPGDILFINSYCFHSLENISSDCEYYCFSAALDLFQTDVNKTVTLPSYLLTSDKRVGYNLDSVAEEFKIKHFGYEILISSLMTAVLVYINRLSDGKDKPALNHSGQNNDKIRSAIIYINEHLTESFSLDDFCKLTSLSRTHFSRIFKSFTGESLFEYINHMRCQYARNLFSTGKYTVAECAEKAGYNNLSYFSRKYREIYGKTLLHDISAYKQSNK